MHGTFLSSVLGVFPRRVLGMHGAVPSSDACFKGYHLSLFGKGKTHQKQTRSLVEKPEQDWVHLRVGPRAGRAINVYYYVSRTKRQWRCSVVQWRQNSEIIPSHSAKHIGGSSFWKLVPSVVACSGKPKGKPKFVRGGGGLPKTTPPHSAYGKG